MKARRAMHAAVAAAVLALAGTAYAASPASASAAEASSAAAAAASGASATAPALPVIGQYTVQPGQSLHDVAVDLTQSHDKTTLARASQAVFDANPAAFMKHDASRLRVGAVLSVPGTPDIASGASGVTPASAPVAAASASAPAATAATAAAASAVAAANASAGAASNAVSTSAPEAAASAASAPTASATSAIASSDAHSWSGAIQAAPSSAASGASAPAPAHVTVSSLQQLLALKSRVLMALQQHGIGKPAQVAGAAPAGAHGGTTAGGAALGAQSAQPDVLPITWGVVAAVVLAFVALIVRLLTRKRRKSVAAADEPVAAVVPPVVPAAPELAREDEHEVEVQEATHEEPPVLHESLSPSGVAEQYETSSLQYEPHAEPHDEPHDEPHVETPQPDAALDHATEAASLSAAAELGADALPPTLFEASHAETTDDSAELHAEQSEHGTVPHGVEADEPQSLADTTEAAGFAAAAELDASALPHEGLEAMHAAGEAEELAHDQAEDAPASEELPHAAEHAANEPTLPVDEVEHAAPQAESHTTEAPEVPEAPVAEAQTQAAELTLPGEPSAPEAQHAAPVVPDVPAVSEEQEMAQLEVPKEFPKSAVDALGSLDMLPPRIDLPEFPPPFARSMAPLSKPETIARQSLPLAEPPAPPVGQAIEAGTSGMGSIAGLAAGMGALPIGAPPMAPRFGTLSLDFDLNLPPDSAEPLPVFTPEQLSRIARNKLDLAHEYIELGDLSGARALINEVIESNDHATRNDARALLSTLSPLS